MGSIYLRGGNYYIDFSIRGKRIRKRVGTSRRLAEKVLENIEANAAIDDMNRQENEVPLDRLFDIYLRYSRANHAEMTTKRYGNVINNFNVFLLIRHPKIKKPAQLNSLDIEEYKLFRKTIDPRNLSLPFNSGCCIRNNCLKAKPRTLRFEIKTLKSVFEFGIRNGLCNANPCKGVRPVKPSNNGTPRFLSRRECHIFLENCDTQLYPIFFTFLNTGLRLGELVNLQWQDIDLKRKIISVREKEFWKPKSGEREIPLNRPMMNLLTQISHPGIWGDNFVFPNKDGTRLKRKLRKDVVRIANRAGIENLTKVHTFRHTFASHLVMSGIDLPTLQKLLGHADIQTTMIYAHLSNRHIHNAIERISFLDPQFAKSQIP